MSVVDVRVEALDRTPGEAAALLKRPANWLELLLRYRALGREVVDYDVALLMKPSPLPIRLRLQSLRVDQVIERQFKENPKHHACRVREVV